MCRLINHMDAHGYTAATPRHPDPSVAIEPLLDFNSGYVLRAIDNLPKQGSRAPWKLHQNYPRDVLLMRHGAIEDEALEFSRASSAVPAPERVAA